MTPEALDARGVASVEFLLAFGTVFLVFLATLQLGLVGGAQLVVAHAARRAARAAVVVLEDDPARYTGEPRGHVAPSGEHARGVDWSALGARLGAVYPASTPVAVGAAMADGPRMAAIRHAAYLPLAALVPSPGTFARHLGGSGATVVDALVGSGAAKLGYGLARHLPLTTAVTFPIAPGASELEEGTLPRRSTLTVRVTHLFHCAVPIVATLLCSRLEPPPAERRDEVAPWNELQHAPLATAHAELAASSARFVTLQAEATLPSQAAGYRYAGEEADR